MKSVAVIACGNGLGHVRRTLLLSDLLVQAGTSVTLFAPVAAVARVSAALGRDFGAVRIADFDTGTSAAALRAGDLFATRWIERLPDVDGFDLVVSDNLPEILERRSDAVLSGSFLWHRQLDGAASGFVRNAEALLAGCRPLILSNALFSTPDLEAYENAVPVGLYAAFARPEKIGTDLLVSCGHGGDNVEGLFAPVIAGLLSRGKTGFGVVHVEPRLLPNAAPAWMIPARFDARLYASLKAAICRPGIGTISDALVAGARIFALFESGNGEMESNTARLTSLDVGQFANDGANALEAAFAFAGSPVAQDQHWSNCLAIDARGGQEAVAILLTRIGL